MKKNMFLHKTSSLIKVLIFLELNDVEASQRYSAWLSSGLGFNCKVDLIVSLPPFSLETDSLLWSNAQINTELIFLENCKHFTVSKAEF